CVSVCVNVSLCTCFLSLVGIMKTHNLSFQECESLQAAFTKDACPNVLKANANLCVSMYMLVSVCVCVYMHMYVHFLFLFPDPSKMMLTEMNLHPEEFEYFQVKEATDITFCLKELRALLSFAENSNLPVSVHFHTAGRPVVFSLEDSVLDVNFVLATLNDRDSHSQRSQTRGGTSIPCPGNPADDFLNDDMDSYMIAMETSMMKSRVAEPPCSPTFPQHSFSWRALTLPLEGQPATHSEEEEDKEIQTPGTPPHKKVSHFTFCSLCYLTSLPP
uniref:RAD9 checkpoint clamp component A n=1 Tax=Latimeria chalumnae TaxID=7897 RepID=H3AMV7_LATCH